MILYKENAAISPQQLAALRQAVGCPATGQDDAAVLHSFHAHYSCLDRECLVGFLGVVSNGVTNAYIQVVMVHPRYQGKGIGTSLMTMAIAKLRAGQIGNISVQFEGKQIGFFRRFGFHLLLAGQLKQPQAETAQTKKSTMEVNA